MSITPVQPDFVLLPVPLKHAVEIASYRDDLVGGLLAETSARVGAVASVLVPGQGSWTQVMVGRLLDQLPYSGVLALFDMCADRAGHWVPKAEAEGAHGVKPIQLRNELGALSKASKRVFGAATWPVEYKVEKGTYYYRMEPQMAGWWAAARSDGDR